MKQILVITRLDPKKPEFPQFYPGESKPVEREYEDYRLSVYDGALIYGAIDYMASNIAEKVDKDASEVLLVIHFNSDEFDDLSDALHSKSGSANWRVAQYSSSDPNYASEIRPTFQAVLSDYSAVERIYWLFTYDPALEAKLNLLHSCLTPNSILPLDNLLLKHKDEYDKFIGRVARVTWQDPLYIAALTELRDSLLRE